jgi:hypothetical protein
VLFVPPVENDQITWHCGSVDIEKKYLVKSGVCTTFPSEVVAGFLAYSRRTACLLNLQLPWIRQ